MLNLKKVLTLILNSLGAEYTQMRNYRLTTNFTVTPKPYKRVAIIIPAYFSVNALKYKTVVRHIAKNATSFAVPLLPIDGGTYTTDSTVSIDADVLIFREL